MSNSRLGYSSLKQKYVGLMYYRQWKLLNYRNTTAIVYQCVRYFWYTVIIDAFWEQPCTFWGEIRWYSSKSNCRTCNYAWNIVNYMYALPVSPLQQCWSYLTTKYPPGENEHIAYTLVRNLTSKISICTFIVNHKGQATITIAAKKIKLKYPTYVCLLVRPLP